MRQVHALAGGFAFVLGANENVIVDGGWRDQADMSDVSDPGWGRASALAAGQVAEFKVWAELIRQSGGGLHVFLPLRDRGIDGVVHRLDDGTYTAVQVKARTSLTPSGQLHITVPGSSLVDDEALMVVALVEGAQLGEYVLVANEADYRRLAAHDVFEGREYLTAAIELHPGGTSRWAPYLVARERLAERFGAPSLPRAAIRSPGAETEMVDRGAEGFLGEAEVIRRLAEAETLALFRPFPDLETVEVLARHIGTHRYAGLQVKTSGWDATHTEERVYVRRSSFRQSPSTWVCVLGWARDERRFADDCLVIPSEDVAQLGREEGDWMVLELQPGSRVHRRLDQYRTRLQALGQTIESQLA